MRLIWKLLRQHISIGEFSVFVVAGIIGMIIMLTGVQLYGDVRPMLTGEKSLIGNDYMIVTKPVKRVGISSTKFTSDEVEAFRNEEFVIDLGEFLSSQYEVYGSVMFNGRKLSTMMFFEAVDDKFVDVETDEWYFEGIGSSIPIIIPRNYLNLYNFGFSQTQGLPQITEALIKSVELDIRLSGNGYRDNLPARVVGFSDRLNTILVPMEFMQWANKRYADTSSNEVSRLIVEVQNPGDPEVMEYLDAMGYQAEERAAESSKALFLLQLSVAVVVLIGLIFSLLSIFILTLSIYLLIEKNSEKLRNLSLIGYTPQHIAKPYNLITASLNLAIFVVSVVVTLLIRAKYLGYLGEVFGIEVSGSALVSIVTGIAISIAITAFNVLIIRRKIGLISSKR
ncbi:MAG: ABC transporter permease [Alistipes sp.]|nr:ABC transporter permease [Alistipes sp.]MBR3893286.1 ABC transporter permease [Alistipes sp.]MBR6631186.1 ABC transporter permease [Alistipes sp.]